MPEDKRNRGNHQQIKFSELQVTVSLPLLKHRAGIWDPRVTGSMVGSTRLHDAVHKASKLGVGVWVHTLHVTGRVCLHLDRDPNFQAKNQKVGLVKGPSTQHKAFIADITITNRSTLVLYDPLKEE